MSAVSLKVIEENVKILNPEASVSHGIAKAMTWYSPRFSPKNVPRFYDISSLTENPILFKEIIDLLVVHYKSMGDNGPTHIIGYDARGFLIGTPLAMGLGLPFVMLRKQEKSPGVLLKSNPYHKEYAETTGADTMALRRGSIKAGDRVVLVDDLIATGGTAISGFELVTALGASIVEFIAIIAIPFCNGVSKIREYDNGRFKDVAIFTLIHDDMIGAENCADPVDLAVDSPRVMSVGEPGNNKDTGFKKEFAEAPQC